MRILTWPAPRSILLETVRGAFLALSPTRALAKLLIRVGWISTTTRLLLWNGLFYTIGLAFFVAAVVKPGTQLSIPDWLLKIAALVSLSRVNEIVFAFYGDALSKIDGEPSRLRFRPSDRVRLAAAGYIELMWQFGIIHYSIQRVSGESAYTKGLSTISDALYFSAMTITTTGYGDISPIGQLARCASLYEALSGVVFIALAISVYISVLRSAPDEADGSE